MKILHNNIEFSPHLSKKVTLMGRKSVRKRCLAIIAVFVDQKITIELDSNENIRNKSDLEDLTAISKLHKRMIKENFKNKKLKRRKPRVPEIQTSNISHYTKEFSFLDDISFETKIINDFFNELEREQSVFLANEKHS